MQKNTSGLNAENKELKFRLQALEQQAHLKDGKPLLDMNFQSYNLVIKNPPKQSFEKHCF